MYKKELNIKKGWYTKKINQPGYLRYINQLQQLIFQTVGCFVNPNINQNVPKISLQSSYLR